MCNEKDFLKIFKESDEGFQNNFEKVLCSLPTKSYEYRSKSKILKLAIIIVSTCVMFSVTVYAAEKIFFESVDVGASWKLVSAPKNYYQNIGTTLMNLIYHVDLSNDEQPQVDSETAQILNDLLKGKIFTSDGELLEIMIIKNNSEKYIINTNKGILYNKEGEELREIRYETTGYILTQNLMFQTKTEYEKVRELKRQGYKGGKLTDDYEEMVRLFGTDFRLPTVYSDEREFVEFEYQNDSERRAVYVTIFHTEKPNIYYFAEAKRRNNQTPKAWFSEDTSIEMTEILGISIYMVKSDKINRYLWFLDEIAYMLFQNNSEDDFDDEQIFKIITSMIE